MSACSRVEQARLTFDEVQGWSETQCRAELQTALTDIAVSLLRAAMILKVMIDRKMDVSALPRTWVRQMVKIADGEILPEVVRDFDGIARQHVARMPIKTQRLLCDNPTVQVLDEFGVVKTEKIQNLSVRDLRLALDFKGPRTIEQQREIFTANDEKPEPQHTPQPGDFDEAIEFFLQSKHRFGHVKELASLYAMIDMFKARVKRK